MSKNLLSLRSALASSAAVAVLALMGFTPGVAAGATSPGAQAAPFDPNAEFTPFEGAQHLLLEVAGPLQDLVDPTEGSRNVTADGNEYGYAGLKISPATSEVDLYWVGEVAPEVEHILAAADSSILINRLAAEYTLFEMQDAARALLRAKEQVEAEWPVDLALAGPRLQGIGVDLEIVVLEEGTEGLFDLAEFERAMASVAGMPVRVLEIPKEYEFLAGRQADSSPETGGAGYNVSGSYCSTGFGVTSENTGNHYMISAYHCFYPLTANTNVTRPGSSTAWGVWKPLSSRNAPEYDASLIETNGSADYRIFSGGITSSTMVSVTGDGNNTIGEYVCTGGANSGTHCGIEVISKNNFTVHGDDGTVLESVVRGRTSLGALAAVGGDSGGPVYYSTSSEKSARGIVSQGWSGYDISCSGITTAVSPGGKCFSGIVWVGVRSILEELGMDLRTG